MADLSALGQNPLRVTVFLTQIVSVGLGLAISYYAYQGYRRNDSRPLLFLAIGFVLVLGIPAILAIALYSFGMNRMLAGVLSQTFQILGLLSILYAIRL
mgnify:FL=1